MLVAMLLAQVQDDAALLATYHARTAAVIRCDHGRTGDDILVCGRRDADRYRIPLIVADAGDRRAEGVPGERTRLLHRTSPLQELSPFLVGGGMAGVTVTQTFGGGTFGDPQVTGWRPLAP